MLSLSIFVGGGGGWGGRCLRKLLIFNPRDSSGLVLVWAFRPLKPAVLALGVYAAYL